MTVNYTISNIDIDFKQNIHSNSNIMIVLRINWLIMFPNQCTL